MKGLHMVAFVLAIVGGLNWGLVGLLKLNVVEAILGTGMLTTLVYILVGLSAVYLVVTHSNDCKTCVIGSGKKR